MNSNNTPTVTVADIELELAIDHEITLCMDGRTRDQRAAALERAQELHKQRRPHMVAYLEEKRGLKR